LITLTTVTPRIATVGGLACAHANRKRNAMRKRFFMIPHLRNVMREASGSSTAAINRRRYCVRTEGSR
jgi:hypothetical protein